MKGHKDSNKRHTLTIPKKINVKVDTIISQRAIAPKPTHIIEYLIAMYINNEHVTNKHISAIRENCSRIETNFLLKKQLDENNSRWNRIETKRSIH